MNENNVDKLLFEEYKLFRDTAIHFDKILMGIRKSTISLAFIIFGLAAETFRISNLPLGSPIDLAIVLILIELLMVMSFFYLEFHYRFYLVKITTVAAEYEEKLGLGIELKDCDLKCDDMRAGISKCLSCIHNRGMTFFTRVAHFNIYTSLLSLGLVAFTALMGIKIGLSSKEVFTYTFITGLIAFGSSIVYVLRDIRKQKEKYRLDDTFSVYLVSIISFVALTYILYYREFIEFSIQNMKFAWSFFEALFISIIIFLIYGFIRKKIEENVWKLLARIGVAQKKEVSNK